MITPKPLGHYLRSLPHEKDYRYTKENERGLLRALFYSLAGDDQKHLGLFFPQGPPRHKIDWKLTEARGPISGAEYTEAARGKRCGHIFNHEEATYFCRTCTTDATCVLCQKCFEASDHDGHHVEVYLSEGSSGCCDCGDDEAWVRPLKCGIHTALESSEADGSTAKASERSPLPPELQESIRSTIGKVFDYMCDVFSCAPESMRLPKHAESIQRDERLARLSADWYGAPGAKDSCDEFAIILWNDEKHTVDEVREQVARACRRRKSYGEEKAREIDLVGRAVVDTSKDVEDLIKKAKILEQIKVTVTIRSSRDLFREQMCDTIIAWLADISACSVGDDHNILMDTVCSEMLKPWRIGSSASNLQIGRQGFKDHQRTDNRLHKMHERDLYNRMHAARAQVRQAGRDAQRAAARANRATATGQPDADDVQGPETENNEENEDNEEDNEDDEDNDDEIDDNDFTIRALLQAAEDDQGMNQQHVFIAPPQNAVVTANGELLATAPLPTDEPSPGPGGAATQSSDDDEDAAMLSPQNDPDDLVPVASPALTSAGTEATPGYWLKTGKKVAERNPNYDAPIEENFHRRVRIDFLILYDLRMWKTLRNNLRRLYIGTVIKVPRFKRILGLRFAAIYRVLAQLYLVSDREPDHSIINLSLQMLTTPTITAEIIDRGNFCTRLLAILYTFLTKRKVGNPEDIDLTVGMNFEAGVIANRRVHHFFNDLRYMLEAKFTHQRLRDDGDYLLQFLDILKLFQGMDSNVRATNEHVPFETDAWMTTVMLIRDLARSIRLFAQSFRWTKPSIGTEPMYEDPLPMCRAVKEIARTAILHSLGVEHVRFQNAEVRHVLGFKAVDPSEFELRTADFTASTQPVVDFVIEKEPMSFHHPLHWALSWVVDEGKSMTKAQLQSQLRFTYETLLSKYPSANVDAEIPRLEPLQYLLALFDVPLRTIAWVAQLKAGMWVRNGFGLRHQMTTFRQVTQREITSQRDIFLLQTAMIVCPPETFLANVIDRFHMEQLIRGNAALPEGWEDHHLMDVAEDFIHLLIVLVSDRIMLRPVDEDAKPEVSQAIREIVHTLCFKPLPYSDLTDRITLGSTNVSGFDQILSSVAHYKAPEGLQDTGTFELRSDQYDKLDPYNYYYSKNQREESENAWRRNEARGSGAPVEDVVFEPHLKPIKTGLFTDIGAFTQTSLFGQVIWGMLNLALHPTAIGKLPPSRVEAFLPLVLYLILIAISEDTLQIPEPAPAKSFVDAALYTEMDAQHLGGDSNISILRQLYNLRNAPGLHLSSKPKIRAVIKRLREKRPMAFDQLTHEKGMKSEDAETHPSKEVAAQEMAEKKRKAQERNARVMAAFKKQQSDFMSHQMGDADLDDWDDLADDIEMRDVGAPPTWSFPKDVCIFCQEETDDQRLYGSLVYIIQSKIFRDTDLEDVTHLQEVGMVPPSYDRDTEGLRPFGIARSNVERVMRVNDNGEAIMHERRGLGKGWPSEYTHTGNVATSCGHLMHYSCFETYNTATTRRHSFQIARNHPERLPLKEFVCPLCKALANTFLPIIFKPKEMLNPSTLVGEGFDDWLLSRTPFLASDSRAENESVYKQEATAYRNHRLQTNYATALVPDPPISTPRSHLAMPSFLGGSSSSASALRDQNNVQGSEPFAAYKRLKETILVNQLDPRHALPARSPTEYSPADVLAGTLGSSIAAAELALRGQESSPESSLFLDKISEQTVTHLRVLSETCSTSAAYVAMGGTYATKQSVLTQRMQLFGSVFGGARGATKNSLHTVAPLLSEDGFEFLTRSMIFLNPYLSLDDGEHHIMQLCLLSEVVKVVVAHLQDFDAVSTDINGDLHERTDPQGARADEAKAVRSPEHSQDFSAFVQTIIDCLAEPLDIPNTAVEFLGDVEVNPNQRTKFDSFLRGSVASFALPFLRKCLLLMHVQAGVDFSSTTNIRQDDPEIDRLITALGLPSIDELIKTCIGSNRLSSRLQDLMLFWITHWRVHRYRPRRGGAAPQPSDSDLLMQQQDSILRDIFSPNSAGTFADTGLHLPSPPGTFPSDEPAELEYSSALNNPRPLRLPHPGIYELVALPETHDTLNAESLSRRCPTTKGTLSDPHLCLFCGDIFCGQAQCCAVEVSSGQTHGGCYRHQLICGGNVGMFFNIRKSAVAFLNGKNGAFFSAPYLDEHGESDFGLKRRGRLFLERRRYDRLFRDVWLGHGVPSAISRKLEMEVNTGGWETM